MSCLQTEGIRATGLAWRLGLLARRIGRALRRHLYQNQGVNEQLSHYRLAARMAMPDPPRDGKGEGVLLMSMHN